MFPEAVTFRFEQLTEGKHVSHEIDRDLLVKGQLAEEEFGNEKD